MISQHEPAQTDEPSTPQIDHQNIFETSFAMHAMHDSLPASPLSVASQLLAPIVQLPVPPYAPVGSGPSRSAELSSRTSSEVSDPGSSSFTLPTMNNGKVREDSMGDASSALPSSVASRRKASTSTALPSTNVIGASISNAHEVGESLTSSPIGFTPIDVARSPSSSQLCKSKVTASFPYAPDVADEPSTANIEALQYPGLFSEESERKLEPYADVSVLGRRIISVIMDTERYTSIYRTTETVAEYEGVHVSVIMEQLMPQDESITPYAVDVEITSLIAEGYIYTTVDDLHVKVTQSH